jgi:hypothetical protein
MRASAMTGDSRPIRAWFAGRQSGWWATQFRRPATSVAPLVSPGRPAAAHADERRRALAELHRRGVIDDAELERLGARLGV